MSNDFDFDQALKALKSGKAITGKYGVLTLCLANCYFIIVYWQVNASRPQKSATWPQATALLHSLNALILRLR